MDGDYDKRSPLSPSTENAMTRCLEGTPLPMAPAMAPASVKVAVEVLAKATTLPRAHEEWASDSLALEDLMRDYGFRPEGSTAPPSERDWPINLTVEKMSTMVADKRIQQQGCTCLWRAVCGGIAERDAVVAHGGVERICTALATHAGCEGVVAMGCGALWSLSVGNSEIKAQIGRQGGIDEVCTGMVVHAGNVEVQTNGCGALWSLTCNASTNKQIAAKANAVQRVCTAMKLHGDCASLQRVACGALACICGSAWSRSEARRFHGAALVLVAMEAYSEVANIQASDSIGRSGNNARQM
eukprot:TRINITY_DN41977_c0_g1_i3.p1 TRINITY_DN41977_c0_g1~~TRINITY_DN41977_c0_g1_i3.p1  ORF type:complete len:299 (-),score=53.55 TRINITY_DN41977_c0_g1_i3:2-898(-)